MRRVYNVARVLGAFPWKSIRLVDFINDFFCFNREVLVSLDRHMASLYGPDMYVRLLANLDPARHQTRFGEWTLYSVYLIDVLAARDVATRDARDGYLEQIHSTRDLKACKFDSKVVHLVARGFEWAAIQRRMSRHGIELESHI